MLPLGSIQQIIIFHLKIHKREPVKTPIKNLSSGVAQR
jgi:hypothetical protein